MATSPAQNLATAAGSIIKPTAISVPSAWNPATRFMTTRVKNTKWDDRARRANGAQEARVEALDNQPTADNGQGEESQRRNRDDEQQRRIVDSENGSEKDMHKVDVAAMGGDDEHPERQRNQIEGGEARVLALRRDACDDTRQDRHHEARDEAAEAHDQERETGDHETNRRARQHGVAQGIADEAHAAQDKQHAHGTAGDAQRQARN